MKIIKQELFKRMAFLRSELKRLDKKYSDLPAGSLYIARRKGNTQYYWRLPGQEPELRYIKKNDTELIRALMQKQYILKLRRSIEEEIEAIDLYLTHLPKVPPEQLFEALSDERRQYVDPELDSDTRFALRWMAETYDAPKINYDAVEDEDGDNEFDDMFRSKSERLIANMLDKNGILYKYEKPLSLRGFTVYPDFTILDIRNRREIYLEHLGMMDKENYLDNAILKLNRYSRAGYQLGDRLLVTMESKIRPLNIHAAEKMVLQALGMLEAS